MKNKGNLLMVITAVMWSTGGVLIKFVPWNSFAINGVRCILAFLVLALFRRSFKMRLNKTIIAAGVCLFLTTTFFVLANKLTTSANAIVLQDAVPIYVLLYQCIATRRAPRPYQIVVTLAAFAGVVLFFIDRLDSGYLLGNIFAILSGVTFAGVFIFNGKPDSGAEDSIMLSCLAAFVLGIPFYFQSAPLDTSGILAILALGIFQFGIPYALFAMASRLTTPASASLISLLEALLSPVWVYLFLGETVGRYALLGAALLLGAVTANILITARASKKTAAFLKEKAGAQAELCGEEEKR